MEWRQGGRVLTDRDLSREEFEKIRRLLHEYCGIYLHEGKMALVRARLMKRMRSLRIFTFSDYIDHLEGDESGSEFLSLVDVLTTNKTSFFREPAHFDYLKDSILPSLNGREVTWWSAGCSTGEEPITLAITFLERMRALGDCRSRVRILATDLSRSALTVAKQGEYKREKLAGIPQPILRRYFQPLGGGSYRLGDTVRSMITYGRLNLNEPWPLRGPFQLIMCRNVMIYFARETQQQLIRRFSDLLEPSGYLFLGHSESVTGTGHNLQNILPAGYRKRTEGRG